MNEVFKDILDNFQEGYRNGCKKAKETSDVVCPFCLEEDFDLPGLKLHFTWCEEFNKTEIVN